MKKATFFSRLFVIIAVLSFTACTKDILSPTGRHAKNISEGKMEPVKGPWVSASIRKHPGNSYTGSSTLGDTAKAY